MGKPVVWFLAIWCFCIALFSASPSNAFSLLDYDFSGFVSSATEVADGSGPPKTDSLMIGEPFSALVQIQQTGSSITGAATLDVNVLGSFFLLSGPPIVPFQSPSGAVYSGSATFINNGINTAGSLNGFTFAFPDGNPSNGILTAQFVIASINRADDSGTLNLTLSAVPLPPSLPLFASALLALGFFGFVTRSKSAIQSALGQLSGQSS
jgi:hypothetical protein